MSIMCKTRVYRMKGEKPLSCRSRGPGKEQESQLTDEERLWYGVLQRAYRDYSMSDSILHRLYPESDPQDLTCFTARQDAFDWFMSDNTDLGSFLSIVDFLKIPVKEARETLLDKEKLDVISKIQLHDIRYDIPMDDLCRYCKKPFIKRTSQHCYCSPACARRKGYENARTRKGKTFGILKSKYRHLKEAN